MKNLYADFTQCYPLSKTLRFSLLPQGKTAENIKKYGILSQDYTKFEMYQKVKPIFDKCHKLYIEERLSQLSFDWNPLATALLAYRKDAADTNKKALEKAQKAVCAQISKSLKSGENFKNLTPKALVDAAKNKLRGKVYCGVFVDHLTQEELEQVAFFDRFSTYFVGYYESRNNIYAADGSTSIAYRLVEDNFPKFLANRSLLDKLDEKLVQQFEQTLSTDFGTVSLETMFSTDAFNAVLSQSGIERYNLVLGGKTEEGAVKRQGLNELCNLAYQQGELPYKVCFAELYKQILADREKASFILETFESDGDVLEAVAGYMTLLSSPETENAIEAFRQTLSTGNFDAMAVYVADKQVAALSNLIYNEWDKLRTDLIANGIQKQKVYTLSDLQCVVPDQLLSRYVEKLDETLAALQCAQVVVTPALSQCEITDYVNIKGFLDAVMALEQVFKIFATTEYYEKDSAFYGAFDVVYALLRENITLYNKVRNYATQKPYSTEKFKLNFGNATLANGWDQNKEYENNAILLLKNGRYYLGIFNAKNKKKLPESDTLLPDGYRKMVYKLLPGPNKMLPKVFFSQKGIETFGVNDDILAGYNEGKHKKGEQFDLVFCHQLIDYFKEKIAAHPDWSKFGFRFSATDSYNDISDFYREVAEQGYKISYSYVHTKDIDVAIENGSLFLFEIYNKDFSAQSTGKPNLHTLYWRQLFAEENLQNPVFKLNGGAELFYRPASLDNPFVHRQGEILVGKTYTDKQPIEEEVYQTILDSVAPGASLDVLRTTYPTVNFRLAPHDIVKDKRYSRDAFAFHVPITLNCNARGNVFTMNERVLRAIDNNPDVRIIGIDRGERNLIYVSVIDQQGHILEQKSFNIVNGTNYLAKLKLLAKKRDNARKNWQSIGKIKDLKEGYLSLVVHEITDMMVKHNAIVTLEDLNFGFKRGRFHIEQQVYQKFEKMLIEKLNYLADKSLIATAEGGISNAYQLTGQFTSFKTLGKQSGFLFYVPARWTSKIDPETGFVNLFTSEQLKYTSVAKAKAFFSTFREIAYDAAADYFTFDFLYSDFHLKMTDYTDAWTVCTFGDERISYARETGYSRVNVTEALKALFTECGIAYDSVDLQQAIVSVEKPEFMKKLLWLFRLTVSLRHEDETTDYILSPVKNANGTFFDSRKATSNQPVDGDANGAYHIALQGLHILRCRIADGKLQSDGKKQEYNWLRFAQRKDWLCH